MLQEGLPQAHAKATKTVLQADRTHSPTDFYIFPALSSNHFLGDSSAIGIPGFISTSLSISNHVNPLPNGSQPDLLDHNTSASLSGDFFVLLEDLAASNRSLRRDQLY